MSGRKNIEMAIQRELIKWLHLTYPQVEIIYRKNEGKKSIITAILDKLAGLAAGVPDLQLLMNYDGWTYILELELKKLKGSLNDNQEEWWDKFIPTKNRKGAIAYGYIQAQEAVRNWVSGIGENN